LCLYLWLKTTFFSSICFTSTFFLRFPPPFPHDTDIFSQISDGAGQLIHWKAIDFVREILALPAAVYESPTFHYDEGLENELFPMESKLTVNDFIAAMVSEPGHACFVWLALLHRLATVESVVHPMVCSSCQRENFSGFRYRCQHSRCHGYQLCQDCFWQGRTSLNHQNDHEVKEYSCYKSPSKQIGHSLRKSFRCVPEKQTAGILPKFPDQPEKTLNLSHIVPPSPLPSHHNGFSDGVYDRSSTLDSRVTGRSLDSTMMNEQSLATRTFNSSDDPHTMMARYAARLAKEQGKEQGAGSTLTESTTQKTQRELISQLEAKNKEIMREIQKLRQQEQEAMGGESPQLVSELRALRQRKGELEGHLGALQDSRRQLMQQLEGLMKLLKNHQTQSPRSTPNSSPRSAKSPPIPQGEREKLRETRERLKNLPLF
jgi:EF-hand/Zinc finger, ZZ type